MRELARKGDAFHGVPTKRLSEQYRRIVDRFPKDFAFSLKPDEREPSRLATSDRSNWSKRSRDEQSHGENPHRKWR